ncbi:MAG TPA: Hsp20/alpha crystallin family protein [Chthonomonadaceae bacterium]|nr:Hsp20/alpha crystallin family protein [Chthonomonadaceae bacterium]
MARYDADPFVAFLRNFQDDAVRNFQPRASQPREHVSSQIWSPAVDIYEDQDKIVVKVDLPGVKQEDIQVEMTGDTITLQGERRFEDEQNRDKYVRVERQYGAFQRSFTIGIPIEADKVKATYRNGILELTIPKAEATKPKKVQVSVD